MVRRAPEIFDVEDVVTLSWCWWCTSGPSLKISSWNKSSQVVSLVQTTSRYAPPPPQLPPAILLLYKQREGAGRSSIVWKLMQLHKLEYDGHIVQLIVLLIIAHCLRITGINVSCCSACRLGWWSGTRNVPDWGTMTRFQIAVRWKAQERNHTGVDLRIYRWCSARVVRPTDALVPSLTGSATNQAPLSLEGSRRWKRMMSVCCPLSVAVSILVA